MTGLDDGAALVDAATGAAMIVVGASVVGAGVSIIGVCTYSQLAP